MSTVSPSATTPPRRDGPWGHPSGSYDYEHASPYGAPRAPGGYYGGPPPPQYAGRPDYYAPPPYEGGPRPPGYWGPPQHYEGYHDRPPVGPRGLPPRYGEPPSPYAGVPPSPTPNRGPHPGAPHFRGPPKHSEFQPPPPRTSSKERKKGDPLSILANVSVGMSSDEQEEQPPPPPSEKRGVMPLPAPTSPLQRRNKPSPITPNTTSPSGRLRAGRVEITPHTPHTPHTPAGRPPLEQQRSWDYSPEGGYMERPPPPPGYYSPRRRQPPPYAEYSPRPHHPEAGPAVVERGSFDSHGDPNVYREPPRPPYAPYYYEDPAYPPPPYWEGPPPPNYPPRYGQYEWGGYDRPEDGYGPPPPGRRPPPGGAVPPYTLVQQPRLEEKTLLRKKFSWKHYPELERFLIANRDEYLKHSNMNYTAEQKQYNNWLTERLLEVAGQHNYVFDPEDFNFVAIRDRIRCYYKSYVQTARKRGLKLPEKKKT